VRVLHSRCGEDADGVFEVSVRNVQAGVALVAVANEVLSTALETTA
jgi:hypothetical protein